MNQHQPKTEADGRPSDVLPETASSSGLAIRFAERGDTGLIVSFIRELADYEHLLSEVRADEAAIGKTLFEDRYAEALIVECSGKPAGFALFFHNYSTFLAKPGIYLEDLFVRPEFRGRGAGKALIVRLAAIALERDCGRLQWACLDWNEPSLGFYRSLGAESLDDWINFRVSGEALRKLASSS
jgi:GNAT superfamily N-acetyltransferase